MTATASQYAAMVMAGLQLAPGAQATSTGGVFALISAAIMGSKVKSWHRFNRLIWLPILFLVALSFVLVGLQNNYDVVIVDQPAEPASQSLRPTGKYHVTTTRERICEPGDNYLGCVNSHIAMFNSVCIDRKLTSNAYAECGRLKDFLDEIGDAYDRHGYEYTTGAKGDWGWPYLRLEPETEMRSNNDARPELTHREHCSFDLGVVTVGTCTPDRSTHGTSGTRKLNESPQNTPSPRPREP